MAKSATLISAAQSVRSVDRLILWAVAALIAIGVAAVYSSVYYFAETRLGGDTEALLIRHLIRIGIAAVALLVFTFLDYRRVAALSKPALVLGLLLLVAVQFVGTRSGGGTRWLEIFGMPFQPSDIARVALVGTVAFMLARKQKYVKDFRRSFVPLFLWIMGTAVLIGIEDLSTAAVLVMTTVVMCFVGRVSVVQLGALGLLGVLLAAGLLMTSPARMDRVRNYVDTISSSEDAKPDFSGEGYQSHQARIAFAKAGVFGTGPGKSTQRDFIPASYNDFILAIIAEEYGLVGVGTVLLLFVVLLVRGYLRVARHAPDPLGFFLAVGSVTAIVSYAFVHAAVNCGLLPVTGLPLPFVSYGGTSMIANGALIGIILNVSRHVPRDA